MGCIIQRKTKIDNNNNNSESYVTEAAREAGAAAELAATRKEVKYAGIVGRHMFEPIAVETMGVFNRQLFGF